MRKDHSQTLGHANEKRSLKKLTAAQMDSDWEFTLTYSLCPDAEAWSLCQDHVTWEGYSLYSPV